MSRRSLKGRRALVTGAGIRIGRTIAETLAAHGVHLALHHRSSDQETRAVAAGIRKRGQEAETFAADFGIPGQAESLVTRVEAEFGPLDIVVLSAAIYPRQAVQEITRASYDEVSQVNLASPFFLARDAGLRMKARGHGNIVTLLDWSIDRPDPEYLPYQIAKAGLREATYGLARALAPEVRVNGVSPGAVLLPEGTSEERRGNIIRKTPLQKIGSPEDVAEAVVYLLEGGDFVTGVVLKVDGGRSLR